MTREYTYDITYKGVSGTITVDTADTTSTVANPGNVNGYGTVTGYAITSITGSFDGQTITGLHDASGTYTNEFNNNTGFETPENTILPGNSPNDAAFHCQGYGSDDRLDFAGIAFNTSAGAFNLYWDSKDDSFNIYDESGNITPVTLNSFTSPCFCRGTRILTPQGEARVETLAIGDFVVTASGENRRIKWIGTRSYSARFARNNRDLAPVVFAAGSICEGAPARELRVSPKHAMFIDGGLIAAERLVNGVSIRRPIATEEVHYYHLELETHDLLIAEGAVSESFLDDDSRQLFQNVASYDELYAAAPGSTKTWCAPRIDSQVACEIIRDRLAARASIAVAA